MTRIYKYQITGNKHNPDLPMTQQTEHPVDMIDYLNLLTQQIIN